MRRWMPVAALALVTVVAQADETKKTAGDAAKTGADAKANARATREKN